MKRNCKKKKKTLENEGVVKNVKEFSIFNDCWLVTALDMMLQVDSSKNG